MTNIINKVSIHWKEIDILRGLAAVLMIVNHVGYQTLDQNNINSSWSANLVFFGSFAPVLFFFITGVGYGIQSSLKKKESHWYLTLNKVVILVLADLLMHWSGGRWLGLDFLGFIGLSSLVPEFIRNSKSPLAYCITGFASVSLMRYLLGPYIHSLGYDQQTWALFGWILGTSSIPGVSYPLSPWLAYPFAGYLIGVAAMHYRGFLETHRLQVVFGSLILGVFPAIAGMIISRHGFSFFRWGTVSFGFFVVSFAVILISIAWSLALCGSSKLRVCQTALSLKGISSLAIVPVHYFLLYLVGSIGGTQLGLFRFYIVSLVILTASFLLARFVEKISFIAREIPKQRLVWFCLVAMFALIASATLSYSKTNTFVVVLTRTLGQLILCMLLVVRPAFIGINAKVGTKLT